VSEVLCSQAYLKKQIILRENMMNGGENFVIRSTLILRLMYQILLLQLNVLAQFLLGSTLRKNLVTLWQILLVIMLSVSLTNEHIEMLPLWIRQIINVQMSAFQSSSRQHPILPLLTM